MAICVEKYDQKLMAIKESKMMNLSNEIIWIRFESLNL